MQTDNSLGQGAFDLDVPGLQRELDLVGETTAVLVDPLDATAEARQSLDDLVNLAGVYRSSRTFAELLEFVSAFRFYSPFNALLVYLQKPGAQFVATARTWRDRYGYAIRSGARPLIILRPRGPFLVVYDIDDTDPLPGAKPPPIAAAEPFYLRTRLSDADVLARWDRMVDNAVRDGIRVERGHRGAHRGGDVTTVAPDGRYISRTGPRGKASNHNRYASR